MKMILAPGSASANSRARPRELTDLMTTRSSGWRAGSIRSGMCMPRVSRRETLARSAACRAWMMAARARRAGVPWWRFENIGRLPAVFSVAVSMSWRR
jgi:hypothetical protein